MPDMEYVRMVDDEGVINNILAQCAKRAKDGHEVTVWFNRNNGSSNFIVNLDGAETMYSLMTKVELATYTLDQKLSEYNIARSKSTWPSNALSTVRALEAAAVDLRTAWVEELQKKAKLDV